MANPEQLAIAQQGVIEWNGWRTANPRIRPQLAFADLVGANLQGAHLAKAALRVAFLRGADLRGADLQGADLREANLSEAHLGNANLAGAYLVEANLSRADVSAANLSQANLRGASLAGANLRGSNLTGTDLTSATLFETIVGDTNLTSALGLESCRHLGPSVLDHTTLAKSGKLPLAFLRGVGLPDRLIEYLPSLLTGNVIQRYACFISYSTKDQEFASRLYNDLQGNGVRCWFAPEDAAGGKKLHAQIDEAIRTFDKLLLILSEASIKSPWVEHEIRRARRREIRERRQMLFPIMLTSYSTLRDWECFDADSGKDLATEVREYFIPDFSAWKQEHDAYQKAFERLLRDLRAEEAAPNPPLQ